MFSAMGTTVVGILINGDEVIVCHAGDSRAYLVRDGALPVLQAALERPAGSEWVVSAAPGALPQGRAATGRPQGTS